MEAEKEYKCTNKYCYVFNVIQAIPEELELAFRYAFVDETDSKNSLVGTNTRREYTWAVNYFIAGHGNKITADYSYLTLDDNNPSKSFNDSRFRLQLDISF